jgi:hypothetical protein
MHRYFAAGTTASFEGKFGPEHNPAMVLNNLGDRYRQAVHDDMHGWLMAERIVRGEPVHDGAYEVMRLLRGARNIAASIYAWGVPAVVGKPLEPGGRLLKFPGKGKGIRDDFIGVARHGRANVNAAMRYSVAKRAKELSEQVVTPSGRVLRLGEIDPDTGKPAQGKPREQLFDRVEIEAEIEKGDAIPEYVKLHERLVETHQGKDGVLDFAEAMGLISAAQKARIKKYNVDYSVAFFRELQRNDARARRNMNRGRTPLGRLLGTSRNLRHPIENLLAGPARVIEAAMENRAIGIALKMANEPGGGMLIQRLKPEDARIRLGIDTIRDAIKREYRELGEEPPDAILEDVGTLHSVNFFLGGQKPFGDNIVTYMNNGKPEYYLIKDPILWRAIEAMHRPRPEGFFNMMNHVRMMVQGAHTATLDFLSRNLARDFQWRLMMTKAQRHYIQNAVRGYRDAIEKNEMYQRWVAAGAQGATLRLSGQATTRDMIRYARFKTNDPRLLLDSFGTVVRTPIEAYRLAQRIGLAMEEGPRLAEFRTALEMGHSDTHAGFLSREVTTDFSVQGDHGILRMARQSVPFFSAMMAGFDKTYRGVGRDPEYKSRAVARVVAYGMLSMVTHAINQRRKEYRDLPQWAKDSGIFFMLDGTDAEGKPSTDTFVMPGPWELAIPGLIGRRMVDALTASDDPQEREMGWEIVKILLNNFGVGPPVIAREAIEQFSNRIIYTGDPIETKAMENMSAHLRAKPGTPQWLQEVAKIQRNRDWQLSPARAEALLRSLFSHWVIYGSALVDGMFFPGGPAKHLDDLPVIRNFRWRGGRYARWENDYYEFMKEIEFARNDVNELRKRHDEELLEEAYRNPDLAWSGAANRSNRYVQQLNQIMRAVARDPYLSPEQKRAELDALLAIRRGEQEAFVVMMEEARREQRRGGR